MAVKIMIDAGHGGFDGGASYNGRKEKDDVLNLALAVGDILKSQGYDVVYTRTTDVYDSPVQKARIGNESGADYFVSIHRNSSPTPNQYNGVQTLIYDDSGIKKTMAENVNKRLEEVGYRNINVDIRPNLAVLRRTSMPAILVEAGFINSDTDNALFDSKFEETAQAIADGINETIRAAGTAQAMSYSADGGDVPDTFHGNQNGRNENGDEVYQILVGIYRSFASASYQMNKFINEGYMAEIYEDDGLFQVRVGEYNDVDDALIAQRELRDKGYETLIVRREVPMTATRPSRT
ncbi:MAG: N-acetylmuramoyl-L-alanine amidase [Clostridium sp.]|nr:N-acetylmuramoyl-L-alanine amidase [Clostridium sp.]MCM1397901.1 N-acetylmuramoyl-L-alanine amidase [Clostridium sp.]MCM1459139.1 N-acetylmuramoyl-L-alanine amidase [Bacteroides sp.]